MNVPRYLFFPGPPLKKIHDTGPLAAFNHFFFHFGPVFGSHGLLQTPGFDRTMKKT
jgi:hypothetical protein